MKFFALAFLAIVATVHAGPISVRDNNVGDIVTVKVKANLDISNKVDQSIVNVIAAYLNQELAVISVDEDGNPRAPNFPRNFEITPEMIERVKSFLESQEKD